jgi:hypothetical protein
MRYPVGLDKECRPLYRAMNKMPGIQTIESCCGHGKDSYRIWFEVKSLKALPALVYWTMTCHVGFRWTVTAVTDCGMCPIRFKLESECDSDKAIEQSYKIAFELERYLKEK